MRINKYIAECGVCSRRKADDLVRSGRVSVNKKIITELGYDVNEQKDVVYVDGKKAVRVTHYDYLLFNKPKGCVTTVNDEKDNKSGRPKENANGADTHKARWSMGDDVYRPSSLPPKKAKEEEKAGKPTTKRRSVMDYIGGEYADKRLFPVGRLDYDSEGLLILTNDGELTYRLTHPSSGIPKTYVVRIEGTIEESDLAALRKGVKVDGVKYDRCKVKVTGVEDGSTRLEVVLTEGKNREIRKMFEAVEKKVIFLKRVAIGELRLGGLSRGGYRELNDNEVAYLKSLASIK